MRIHFRLLLLVVLCTAAGAARAQTHLRAAFTANPLSGCAPLVVTFTDASTGNPTGWQWDLGNGVHSTQAAPSTIYINPGSYTVKLVVYNAQGADSVVRTHYITVNAVPQVAFGSPLLGGCAPFATTFADSSSGDLPLVDRRWDFGDGTLGAGSNPAHTYTAAGQYGVSLTVTNSAGCVKTLTRPQYIRVSGRPVAAFANTDPARCSVPHNVQFSAAAGAVQYQWDFGDGAAATGITASHTYTTAGNYTVTLIATNAAGCRDTLRKPALVQVGASAAFWAPDTVCARNPVAFANQSNPVAPLTTWVFGDGTSSTDVNPVKAFATAGTYTVELRNVYADCRDSIRHTIVVKPGPQAAFDTRDTFSCNAPYAVHFQNSSSAAVGFRWDFGDGSGSVETAPVHTYAAPGNFTVRLVATSANGCSDTLERIGLVRIQAPVLQFGGLPVSGCVPQVASPTVSVSGGSAITSWHWQFGDGSTAADALPTHTYAAPGSYTVTATVTTENGCTVTDSLPRGVLVFRKPRASFDLTPGDVCAFQGIQFTNTSSNTDTASTWLWTFGDGTHSTTQDPYHEYDGVGWFSVQLIASNGTCRDTIVRPNVLFVRPPVARFLVELQCSDRLTRHFNNRSVGALTAHWDFGDGTTSDERSPTHTYAAPGSYRVVLRVTNDTCYHTRIVVVDVFDEKADFVANAPALCYGQPYKATAQQFNAAHIRSWNWDFGDGTSSTTAAEATHIYTRPGTFTLTLTITDPLGCTSSFSRPVAVHGPVADFTHDGRGACLGSDGAAVQFTDRSRADGSNAIVQWYWNFGDGHSDSTGVTSPLHRYGANGNYSVTLRVTDGGGCVGYFTAAQAVHVSRPTAAFSSLDTATCTGRPVRFQNVATGEGSLRSVWSFGDGVASAVTAPVHAYAATGTYTVQLKVTDTSGCSDSLLRPAYIRISYPRARFTLSDSTASCPPLLVQFGNNSTDYTGQAWDFGNGNSSTLAAPAHLYTEAGIYHPRLIVTGPGGCRDTLVKTVRVEGPRGRIDYSPLQGCSPLTVHLQATTQARDSLIWDFGDGNLLPGRDSVLTHVFTDTGRFVPRAILVDARGCSVPAVGRDTIHAWVPPVRAGAGFVYCPGRPQALAASGAVSYSWNASPYLSCLHCATPLATPPAGTTFVVTGTDAFGCQARDSVRVNVQGSFRLQAPLRADTLCAGGSVQLHTAGAAAYSWTPAAGLSDPACSNPLAHPAATTTYKVVGTDSLHCYRDSALVTITVYPVPEVDAGPDLLLRAGDTARLQVRSSPDIRSWRWTPTGGLSCSNCPAPVVHAAQNTRYQVQVTNEGGCSSRDAVQVTVLCDGGNLFLPNTFSPNGDGTNDRFYPRGTGLYAVRMLRVYNRWGEVVFERQHLTANDPEAGWDGRVRGTAAPADVYIYTCEVQCANGTILPVKGDLTLLR